MECRLKEVYAALYLQARLSNPQSYTLGLVDKYSETLDTKTYNVRFNNILVEHPNLLVMSYPRASSVMLRRSMCWEKGEVGLLPNAAEEKTMARVRSQVKAMSSTTKKQLQRFNAGDNELFKRINMTFWRDVGSQVGFYKEMQELATRAFKAKAQCQNLQLFNATQAQLLKHISYSTSTPNPGKRFCAERLAHTSTWIKAQRDLSIPLPKK